MKNDQKNLGSGLNSFLDMRKINESRFKMDKDKNLDPLESRASRLGVSTVIRAYAKRIIMYEILSGGVADFSDRTLVFLGYCFFMPISFYNMIFPDRIQESKRSVTKIHYKFINRSAHIGNFDNPDFYSWFL
ncbi:MAG: hypothetical protein WCM93_10860 [Bacteroidota bacterium]